LDSKFILKHSIFTFLKLIKTRHKGVNSLKTCKLQRQLVIGELGAGYQTFKNAIARPVVLQYRYGLSFVMFL